jgi:hypothetical protein
MNTIGHDENDGLDIKQSPVKPLIALYPRTVCVGPIMPTSASASATALGSLVNSNGVYDGVWGHDGTALIIRSTTSS